MGTERALRGFRKHAIWYLTGMPVGGEFRRRVQEIDGLDDLDEVLASIDPDAPLARRRHPDPPQPQGRPQAGVAPPRLARRPRLAARTERRSRSVGVRRVTADAPLVLASGSPRRRVLLAMLQVPVEVAPADLDEDAIAAGLDPMEAVAVLAKAKADAVDGDGRPVLAADTVVSLDDESLGKPVDRDHARSLLRRQSGQIVQVISCVAVKAVDGTIDDRIAISTLRVQDLDGDTIEDYLATGEADDKAGALAVQGAAKAFTELIDGSRSNVVGLPLAETIELLRNVGVDVTEPGALD